MMTAEQFKTEMMQAYPAMRGLALRMLRNHDDAADALQDAAASLWMHADTLDRVDNMRSYFLTATRNACISRLRGSHDDMSIDEAGAIAGSDEALERIEADNSLEQMLQRLPPLQRQVISLSICNQLDNKAIAETLGLSYDSVRQSLSRARRTLRQLYNNLNNPGQ